MSQNFSRNSRNLAKEFDKFLQRCRSGQVVLRGSTGIIKPQYLVLGREKRFTLERFWLIDKGHLQEHIFSASRGLWDAFKLVNSKNISAEEALEAFVNDSFKGNRRMTEKEIITVLRNINAGAAPVPYGFFESSDYWGFYRDELLSKR